MARTLRGVKGGFMDSTARAAPPRAGRAGAGHTLRFFVRLVAILVVLVEEPTDHALASTYFAAGLHSSW